MKNTVCVVGLGYIGLPTASLLASKGFEVKGVDVTQSVVDTINEGKIHIVEPGLDLLVKSAVQSGKLTASTTPAPADIFILAVPTPFKDDRQPELKYIKQAAQNICPYLQPGNLVILESTSPVGTTDKLAEWIFATRQDLRGKLHIAHCPERVLPGQIIRELVDNDRIVGGIDPESTEKAAQFYLKFVSGEVLSTNARTAELAKLSENSFRDVNIAFANELSLICNEHDVNVWELIGLANRHPRVDILNPGPGVGGHCIAVDPWFIVASAPDKSDLIRTARVVNDNKPKSVVQDISAIVKDKHVRSIACLGLAYKPNVDDLRESPSVAIVKELASITAASVLAVEPFCSSLPEELLELGIQHCELEHALAEAELVVALVPHKPFYNLDKDSLANKIILDPCGLFR